MIRARLAAKRKALQERKEKLVEEVSPVDKEKREERQERREKIGELVEDVSSLDKEKCREQLGERVVDASPLDKEKREDRQERREKIGEIVDELRDVPDFETVKIYIHQRVYRIETQSYNINTHDNLMIDCEDALEMLKTLNKDRSDEIHEYYHATKKSLKDWKRVFKISKARREPSFNEHDFNRHIYVMNQELRKGIPSKESNEWIKERVAEKELLVGWFADFKTKFGKHDQSKDTIKECEDVLALFEEVIGNRI